MKSTLIIIVAACCLMTLGFFISCSKASDKKVEDAQNNAIEAQQDANTAVAENEAQKEWQVFKTDAEAKIAANEQIITNYKDMMTDANGKLKAKYDKKIDALEAKNKELKAKLDNYKDEGKTKWEQFQSEFNNDIEKLGTTLKGFTVENKR